MPTDIQYYSNGEAITEDTLNRPMVDLEANLTEIFTDGIPNWNTTTTYEANSFVKVNGVIYYAISSNLNKEPTANPAIWGLYEGNRQATTTKRGTVTISDAVESTSTTTAASSNALRLATRQATNTIRGTATISDATDSQSSTTSASSKAVNDLLTVIEPDTVPTGLIAMWSGSIANIPAGWALCNGANGTPDLQNRFVVGAGSTYGVGVTGGADSVTLTQAQIPSHTHSISSNGGHSHTASSNTAGNHSHSGSTNTTGSHNHTISMHAGGDQGGARPQGSPNGQTHIDYTGSNGNHNHSLSINSNGSHSHTITVNSVGDHSHTIGSIGGDGSHENRPPYYALAYIMKL